MRGYSMLILLQELMYRTYVEIEGKAPRRDQIPKPCDHFDLIAGTGTGGLIAIMLGRLRLDLETCKDVYVRMTKKVFETDKTIAGIPYRSTLFKASKLEEAIRECVREHTTFEDEGNDGAEPGHTLTPMSPITLSSEVGALGTPRRTLSRASVTSGISLPAYRNSMASMRWGDPNASLYDARENRTKTSVSPTRELRDISANVAKCCNRHIQRDTEEWGCGLASLVRLTERATSRVQLYNLAGWPCYLSDSLGLQTNPDRSVGFR